MKGENYEILVGDALVHLGEFQRAGQLFDLILLDLTDVPIDSSGAGHSKIGTVYIKLTLVFMVLGCRVVGGGLLKIFNHNTKFYGVNLGGPIGYLPYSH